MIEVDNLTKTFTLHLRGGIDDIGEVVRRARQTERLVQEWQLTFDASPDLMLVTDRELRIVRCNLAVSKRVGRETAGLVGLSCHEAICDGTRSAECSLLKGEQSRRLDAGVTKSTFAPACLANLTMRLKLNS